MFSAISSYLFGQQQQQNNENSANENHVNLQEIEDEGEWTLISKDEDRNKEEQQQHPKPETPKRQTRTVSPSLSPLVEISPNVASFEIVKKPEKLNQHNENKSLVLYTEKTVTLEQLALQSTLRKKSVTTDIIDMSTSTNLLTLIFGQSQPETEQQKKASPKRVKEQNQSAVVAVMDTEAERKKRIREAREQRKFVARFWNDMSAAQIKEQQKFTGPVKKNQLERANKVQYEQSSSNKRKRRSDLTKKHSSGANNNRKCQFN